LKVFGLADEEKEVKQYLREDPAAAHCHLHNGLRVCQEMLQDKFRPAAHFEPSIIIMTNNADPIGTGAQPRVQFCDADACIAIYLLQRISWKRLTSTKSYPGSKKGDFRSECKRK